MTNPVASVLNCLALYGDRTLLKWNAYIAQKHFPAEAENLLAGFHEDKAPSVKDYANLFGYFMIGFAIYRSPLGAHADYAGMGSYNGPAMDRLEGFSRIAPLAAAWLHGGRASKIPLPDGTQLDLADMLRTGILAGTDPASKEYWGPIQHWGQAIVEAADIALALWLSRDQVWNFFGLEERSQIGRWLIKVNGKRIPDNNWHLFVAQVNAVLAALGEPCDSHECELHYQRTKAFYRGQGWFRDGERDDVPGFDYYNAWGFHYQLRWLRQIAPGLDGEFMDNSFREFVETYSYLIGPKGLPMLGRSACYRMAAPVPLIFAQAAIPHVVSPGMARRSLDVVWQYFARHGAIARGNVSQGYFGPDLRLLEDYSGPASCLWSLRSLVTAFSFPDDHAFWMAKPEALPVEQGDYRISVGPTGWVVTGNQSTGVITIATGQVGSPCLEKPTLADRVLDPFSRKPRRPKNTKAKYYRARYVSDDPYGLSEIPGR